MEATLNPKPYTKPLTEPSEDSTTWDSGGPRHLQLASEAVFGPNLARPPKAAQVQAPEKNIAYFGAPYGNKVYKNWVPGFF